MVARLRAGNSPLDKAPDAFRTISEVADEISVPQHVLRFWESRFSQIRPMKRGGGRRYYRPDDVDLLRGVRHLLYGEGYTIRGVQRILREEGAAFVQNVWRDGAKQPAPESEEDRADEDVAETADQERPDPTLFGRSSSRAQERSAREASAERREPTSASAATVAQGPPRGGAAEDRRRLQTVLDELVDCRRLITAALTENAAVETAGESGGI
jgi:DNA-binding transcriptional MerR regulator